MDQVTKLLPGETVDLDDDLLLNELVDLIQDLLELELFATIVSEEQWAQVLRRLPRHEQSRARFMHVLPDPNIEHHLLVSPSGLRGINAKQEPIIAETVVALLNVTGPPAPAVIRRGLHDLLLSVVHRRSSLSFPTIHYQDQRRFVHRLIQVLMAETNTDFPPLEWLCEIKRDPEILFKVLRGTVFAKEWVKRVKRDNPDLAERVFAGHVHNKSGFIAALKSAQWGDELTKYTDRLLQEYLQNLRSQTDEVQA